MEEFTPAEYEKLLNKDGDLSTENMTDEEKTAFHLVKLMSKATNTANAGMRCYHCNGTGWSGNFNCPVCKGTGGH